MGSWWSSRQPAGENEQQRELTLVKSHLLTWCCARHDGNVTSVGPKSVGPLETPWSFDNCTFRPRESLGDGAQNLCLTEASLSGSS